MAMGTQCLSLLWVKCVFLEGIRRETALMQLQRTIWRFPDGTRRGGHSRLEEKTAHRAHKHVGSKGNGQDLKPAVGERQVRLRRQKGVTHWKVS